MKSKILAFEDPNHKGNSIRFQTKNKCVNLAGTMWSPYWCFKHNVERMKRLNKQFDEMLKEIK